jgi:hypothetical protein
MDKSVNPITVPLALMAWIPLVCILSWTQGMRRAVIVGVLGAFLVLPKVVLHFGPESILPVDKRTVSGVALLLGVLISDPQAFSRLRLSWLDGPMLLYLAHPLTGLVFDSRVASLDAIDLLIQRGLGWGVPYLMGRLYFGDPEGSRDVAISMVWAGLAYLPLCMYEEVVGPRGYVAGFSYGIHPELGMVDRLGGWRPEGFLNNGLELATWMALTAVMAVWLVAGANWRPGRVPGWVLALALVLTSISCRGVYGYLILAAGLLAIVLTQSLRGRWPLLVLTLIPLGYAALRLSGVWDAQGLVELASRIVGRPGTVAFRLAAEDTLMGHVLRRAPLWGFGTYVWHADPGMLSHWPDGWWLHHLWMGGLVGLIIHSAALYLVPAGAALVSPSGRPTRAQAASPSWGLALFLLLYFLDGLHNTAHLTPAAWAGGSVIGQAVTLKRPRSSTQSKRPS